VNSSVAIAAAVTLIAQAHGIPRKVVCLCNYCVEEIDPRGEAACHRAPNSAECERCSNRKDWERAGLCFVILPVG